MSLCLVSVSLGSFDVIIVSGVTNFSAVPHI